MTTARLSVFIDGGHYNALQKYYGIYMDFPAFVRMIQTRVAETADVVELVHVYYYDCLPMIGSNARETWEAAGKRQTYFNFLRSQPAVIVREGFMAKHTNENGLDMYHQKGVDLLLGLDIANECEKQIITHIALLSGDQDFLPAIDYASKRGINIWFFHAPLQAGMVATSLWSAADRRIEIDRNLAEILRKDA